MGDQVIFVDDSGNREYADDGVYGLSGKSRYFVLGAVLTNRRDAGLLVARLRDLKQLTFGTPDVEVKSNWLRMPDERLVRYLQPFAISDERLTAFTDDYYRLIVQAPITLIASVVDKVHMRQRYGPNAWYPHAAAYDALMQRAAQAVAADDSLSVRVDDIGGSTPNHNPYATLLAKHHEILRTRGSSLQPRISFACLSSPVKFVNSARYDLVQVADLAAYNVHRQFRDFGVEWETVGNAGRNLPMYEYFRRISGKFRKDDDGRVQGFGIVKFPLFQRVLWRVQRQPEG